MILEVKLLAWLTISTSIDWLIDWFIEYLMQKKKYYAFKYDEIITNKKSK